MAFHFSAFCDLLERLEDIVCHDPPYLPADGQRMTRQETERWFKSHRGAIDRLDGKGAKALLSTLLPERRADRVYNIQNAALLSILCRSLGLSASRAGDLQAYKQPGHGDLATCLERVLRNSGPPADPKVTVGEVDDVLHRIAGQSRFSAPSVRRSPESSDIRCSLLGNLFQRSHPHEAKWLVRLILKDFSPVTLDDKLVLRSFHFLLPDLLRFQNDLNASIDVLKGALQEYPGRPDYRSEAVHRRTAAQTLRPVVGVKVSRADYVKGRSIDNCLSLMRKRKWMVERKYDGEYCEIHVDLSKGKDWIKIFSKSGKDSTEDRRGLHDTIRKCLRIGTGTCKIQHQCILLGELVTFSDRENRITEFHRIRKHISRSGVFLGTEQDSYTSQTEHLMIVFFDLLLLDDEVVMNKPLEERKEALNRLYTKKFGRAMTAESRVIDTGEPNAKQKLIKQFAASLAERCEGLLLKPCGAPFFSLMMNSVENRSDHGPLPTIKLKPDYIQNMGDEADFAVVGASYDAQEAQKCGLQKIRWTHFHLGCIMNTEEVNRFGGRPKFKIVWTMAQDQCIPATVLETINMLGQGVVEPYQHSANPSLSFDLDTNYLDLTRSGRMDVVFKEPFVFEVLGSSFVKPASSSFWMLRHPRVRKLHQDRSWRKCISFDELQKQAEETLSAPRDSESHETLRWISKIEESCKRKFARSSCNTTPRSNTTVSPTLLRHGGVEQTTPSKNPPVIYVDPADSSDDQAMTPSSVRRDVQTLRVLISAHNVGTGTLPTPPTSSPTAGDQTTTSPSRRKRLLEDVLESSVKRARTGKEGQLSTPFSSEDKATNPHKAAQGMTSTVLTPFPTALHKSGRQKWRTTKMAATRRPVSEVDGKPEPLPEPLPGFCLHRHAARSNVSCPFTSCVFLVTPSAGLDGRAVEAHGGTVVLDHSHWDRGSFVFPPLSDTVSESQAYAGMRKVVLVDANDEGAVSNAVSDILALNQGQFRERVDFYAAEVVEMVCPSSALPRSKASAAAERTTTDQSGDVDDRHQALMQKYLIGTVTWYEGSQRSLYRPAGRS